MAIKGRKRPATESDKRRPDRWFPRAILARIFGISPNSFDRYVRPLVPPEHVRGRRNDLRFYAPGVLKAWLEKKLAEVAPKPGSEEWMLDGAGGAELERWKTLYAKQKALLAQMDREAREDNLVAVSQVRELLAVWAARIRAAGETLLRDHGAEAQAILNEAITDANADIQRRFGTADDAPDG